MGENSPPGVQNDEGRVPHSPRVLWSSGDIRKGLVIEEGRHESSEFVGEAAAEGLGRPKAVQNVAGAPAQLKGVRSGRNRARFRRERRSAAELTGERGKARSAIEEAMGARLEVV